MPLPSVLKGAKQCQVNCKRTGIRCKNPCAFGSKKACRMHGSHKSKNVLSGTDHPQYKHGGETKSAKKAHQETLLRLAYLEAIGEHIKMFVGRKIRGRKPMGYKRLNLENPDELIYAISKTSFTTKN